MHCEKNCSCILCLQLTGCEKCVNENVQSENFILCKSGFERPKKLTFFGMELDIANQKNSFSDDIECKINSNDKRNSEIDDVGDVVDDEITKRRHKSVIYVGTVKSTSGECTVQLANKFPSKIISKETLDEQMSLVSTENSKIVTVVFHDTFSYATQIVNELTSACDTNWSDNEDDFPLGMEAEYLTRNPHMIRSTENAR